MGGSTIYDLVEDHQGNIWATINNGLSRFNPVTQQFKQFLFDSTATNGLSSPLLWDLYLDSKNKLWAGAGNIPNVSNSKSGLHLYNPNR